MNIFETVKYSVTTRQAAEHYGLKVTRNGMACCPFHDDRHPSMKVDRRYHCFGCLADGDVIDFVANLYGVEKLEAARKLAEDFQIPYEKKCSRKRSSGRKRPAKVTTFNERYRKAKIHFWRIITDYYHLLCDWRVRYAPGSLEEEWDDRFVEAERNITYLEYVMDTFLEGSPETRADILIDYGGKIAEYERRIRESAAGETGGTGTGNTDNGAGTGTGNAA